MNIVKVCKKHGELSTESVTLNIKKEKYRYFRCKQCAWEWHKKNTKTKEYKERRKNWYRNISADRKKAHGDQSSKAQLARRAAFTAQEEVKFLAKRREAGAKNRREVSDSYVKGLIVANSKVLKVKDITNSALIELKRAVILLKRKLKDEKY